MPWPTSASVTVYREMGRTDDAKHEVEEYQKYKAMKEKLQEIYHEMHVWSEPLAKTTMQIPDDNLVAAGPMAIAHGFGPADHSSFCPRGGWRTASVREISTN